MDYTGEKSNENFVAYVRRESVENVAELILFRLGFKSNLLGTQYLKEAIVSKYTTKIDSLCRHLYPLVATKFNTKSARVERSIRHTINECHASGKLLRANDLLGWQMVTNYPPTNSEFISSICTWMRLERRCVDSINSGA